MPTLVERLDVQIAAQVAEKQRLVAQAQADAAAVDVKLAALRAAKRAMTAEIEAAYAQLTTMGLFKEF